MDNQERVLSCSISLLGGLVIVALSSFCTTPVFLVMCMIIMIMIIIIIIISIYQISG